MKAKAKKGLVADNLKLCFTGGLSALAEKKAESTGLAFGPWLRSAHTKGGINTTRARLARAHAKIEASKQPRMHQKRLRLAGPQLDKAKKVANAAGMSLAHYFRALAALTCGWKG